MSEPMNDHGMAEGYLAECEQEVRQMGRALDTLKGQLAQKERENQRLLVIQRELAALIDEQARRIHELEGLVALQEAVQGMPAHG